MSQNELLQDDARDAGVATLVELLDYRAARHPHDIVFRFLSGDGVEDGVLTFEALRDRAQSIAAALGEYASPGDRVVLLVPPGLEYVASFFGCLYAGVVAVPAYPPNPRRADPRVHGIIADSEARVALVHASLAARLESWLALGGAPSGVRWIDVSSLKHESVGARTVTPTASDLAMLQYTSGSTGDPRGVMLTHANLLHNSAVIHRVSEHRAGDSGVFWLPPFHDMGLIGGIVAPVYAGRPAALMAPATFLQRPLRWLEAMARYRATTSGAPNFAYDLCVDRTTEAERASLDLSAWRTSFNGAEPVRADTIARFEAAFAVSGLRPNVVLPCYGLAESTLFVSGGPAEQPLTTRVTSRRALEEGRIDAPSAGEESTLLAASGEPAREHDVRVVDPDTLEQVTDDAIGEIWISSPSVAQGYWGRPQESAATFGARCVGSEATYLRTGDLGSQRDGRLFVTGRLKDLIILQGRNFYPHDIELAAERSHANLRPGYSAAFCVGAERGEQLVLALEVSRHHAPEEDDALIHAVRSELASSVGVVPTEIVLLRQHTIARTSSGKIQRGACRASFLDGSLDVVGRWRGAPPTGALEAISGGPVEEFLRAWVRDELQIEPSALRADTPLADIGLDSLAATRLAVALEGRFGRHIELGELWGQPSVGALARHLASVPGDGRAALPSIEPRERPEIVPDRVTDVGQWPEYRALRQRLDLLDAQDIESPFFQVHDGVTGSHATIRGRRVVNFANYNYLGLSGDPDVTRAAQDAVARWGSSVSASRVVSGERPVHAALESEIARFIGADDALVYIGGHPANVSTISHLFNRDDVILCDALMHNSAVQGAEFSGARRLTFPHNDWRALDAMLHRVRSRHRRALVLIEGVYSADGDIPDLERFVEVKDRHAAMLMVDEAHSLGVLGATGRGIAEHAGVSPTAVDIWMGTLSKSLASCGGYIAGSSALIEYLKYTSPGFVYSVGIPPSNAAAALASLRKLIAEPQRVTTLRKRAAFFLARCREEGLDTGASADTPVIPVIVGDSLRATRLSAMLLAAGVNVQPMVAPAVANRAARLRFFVASTHTEQELTQTVRLLVAAMQELDAGPTASEPPARDIPSTVPA